MRALLEEKVRTMEVGGEENQLQLKPLVSGLGLWLYYLHGSNGELQTFFDLSEHRCETESIPEMQNHVIVTCFYGWLVLLDMHSTDFCLLNPISRQKIELPSTSSWTQEFNCGSVLSLPPDNPNCFVIFFVVENYTHVSLKFCKPGDSELNTHDLELPLPKHPDFDARFVDNFRTVGVYNGEIYMLTLFEKLFVLKVDDRSGVTLLDMEVDYRSHTSLLRGGADPTYYLVEACGELLLVDLCLFHHNDDVMDIRVFRLDFDKKAWIKRKRMDGVAIFVSLHIQSFAISTKDTRIQGNVIYFTLAGNRNLFKYDLEFGTVEIHLPCPDVRHNWSQPKWMLL